MVQLCLGTPLTLEGMEGGDNSDGQSTPPGDPPPLLNVIVQGCSPCRAGDDIRISLDFSNPGREASVEVLAISHFPDGVTVHRFLDEDLKVTLSPGESVMGLSPITVPAGLPTGIYFLEAALLHRLTGRTLSRHSVPVPLVR